MSLDFPVGWGGGQGVHFRPFRLLASLGKGYSEGYGQARGTGEVCWKKKRDPMSFIFFYFFFTKTQSWLNIKLGRICQGFDSNGMFHRREGRGLGRIKGKR